MWFDIWFLARGLVLGDICLTLTTSCSRINSIFSTSVMLFSQIVCLWECLWISLFLKIMQSFVWKIYKGVWKVLSWWSESVMLFIHQSLSPVELFWVVFFLCLCCYFLNVPLLLENRSVASHYFLHIFLVLLRGLPQ